MKKSIVVALAALCLTAFASAAWAAGPKVTIGARLLTDIGYWNQSKELTSSQNDVTTAFVNVPNFTYLTVKFTSPDNITGGLIQLGLGSLQPAATVNLRHAYGWYQYGRCRLVVGQTDNWFGDDVYFPSQVVGLNENSHRHLLGWGYLWPHRTGQVQFTWQSGGFFGLQAALEDPRYKSVPGHTGLDFYFTLPRISITTQFKFGGFLSNPGFSYVRHEVEGAPSNADDSWTTWAVVLPVKYTVGGFTLKFQFHHGINFYQEYPFYPSLTQAIHSPNSNQIQDTFVTGGMLALAYTFGDFTITAGMGYERFDNDSWKRNLNYKDDSTDRKSYFIAVPIKVNKFFTVHPELSYFDYGDSPATGADAGKEWLAGVEFSVIF